MCTVTFLPCEPGYLLGMNRDEQLSRVAAFPPKVHDLGTVKALFPYEPEGGTWIGVNEVGASFALVNWYAVTRQLEGAVVSRGRIPVATLALSEPSQVETALTGLPLARIRPFRLWGVFPRLRSVREWRWNLRELSCHHHRWRPLVLISSGFDEAGAHRSRSRQFRAALKRPSAGRVAWMRRLHCSHEPIPGPYSWCMHRSDAATVSYTEVRVSRTEVMLSYTPGPPCTHAPLPALRLPLRHSD